MAIESRCSGCGRTLSVGEEHAGKQARCPACGQIYTIPHRSAAGSTAGGPSEPEESLAETSSSTGNNAGAGSTYQDQFWMRSTDGSQYGPVDRQTLNRWFHEGRVGTDYQIRQGELGPWQPADIFRPIVGGSGNPYADNPCQPTSTPGVSYAKPDQSGIVLAMGILSFILCPIFAVVAWVMGSTALKDIQAGRADPRNKGMVQVGYYLGIANVIMTVLCFGGYFVFFVILIASGGM